MLYALAIVSNLLAGGGDPPVKAPIPHHPHDVIATVAFAPGYPEDPRMFMASPDVETLYWIRDLVQKGASWFTEKGCNGSKGLRTFSVSGRVKEPGVKIADAGITVRELIEEYCGGMQGGHKFKGYLPGGASGGILPASMDSEPLDFGTLEQYGCLIGSAAVIILSEEDSTGAVALNLMKFFEDESCGQCTPCRNGCEKAVQLLEQPKWDKPLLEELSTAMQDTSICGLGQAATNGLNSVFKYFPEDVK